MTLHRPISGGQGYTIGRRPWHVKCATYPSLRCGSCQSQVIYVTPCAYAVHTVKSRIKKPHIELVILIAQNKRNFWQQNGCSTQVKERSSYVHIWTGIGFQDLGCWLAWLTGPCRRKMVRCDTNSIVRDVGKLQSS